MELYHMAKPLIAAIAQRARAPHQWGLKQAGMRGARGRVGLFSRVKPAAATAAAAAAPRRPAPVFGAWERLVHILAAAWVGAHTAEALASLG